MERTFPYYSVLISMYLQSHRSVKYCTVLQEQNRRLRITKQSYDKVLENHCGTFSHLSFLFYESVVRLVYWRKNPIRGYNCRRHTTRVPEGSPRSSVRLPPASPSWPVESGKASGTLTRLNLCLHIGQKLSCWKSLLMQ